MTITQVILGVASMMLIAIVIAPFFAIIAVKWFMWVNDLLDW